MEDLKKLKRFRAGYKGYITNASKDLSTFLVAADAQKVQAKYTAIKTTLNKFQANNAKIYELLVDE